MVNKSGDSDVAINNAAPVKVIKAACSNHAMPVIHAPPAQQIQLVVLTYYQ